MKLLPIVIIAISLSVGQAFFWSSIFAESQTNDSGKVSQNDSNVNSNTKSDTAQAEPVDYNLLFKQMKTHRVVGYTCAGFLLAAGIMGSAHYYSFIQEGHKFRDETIWDSASQKKEIQRLWNGQKGQALRAVHIGFVITGGSLYLANGILGATMPGRNSRELTPKRKVHRAFVAAHFTLMVANVVMGFMTTRVLSEGDHQKSVAFGVTHAIIGYSVPLLIIGSGVAMSKMRS